MHSAVPDVFHNPTRIAAISAALLLILQITGASIVSAVPVVSTEPEPSRPATGASVVVNVFIDMDGTGELLGSYSITLSWDHSILQYQSVSGGASAGYTTVGSNAQDASSGVLLINQFSTSGASGNVHVASVTFTAVGSSGQSTSVTPSVTALASSGTFADLTGALTVSAEPVQISAPSLMLTDPNGGETWYSGTTHQITWNASGISTVSLYYSMNNGSTWTLVASSVNAAAGAYVWSLPAVNGDQCLVRVTDTQNPSTNDRSNLTFTMIESGLWGDVDADGAVTIVDAIKIATYAVNPSHAALTDIITRMAYRADVDNSGTITAADAQACAVCEVNPDDPSLPNRVGKQLESVP